MNGCRQLRHAALKMKITMALCLIEIVIKCKPLLLTTNIYTTSYVKVWDPCLHSHAYKERLRQNKNLK